MGLNALSMIATFIQRLDQIGEANTGAINTIL